MNRRAAIAVLPCPVCGRVPNVLNSMVPFRRAFVVSCYAVGRETSHSLEATAGTRPAAVRRWNRLAGGPDAR